MESAEDASLHHLAVHSARPRRRLHAGQALMGAAGVVVLDVLGQDGAQSGS